MAEPLAVWPLPGSPLPLEAEDLVTAQELARVRYDAMRRVGATDVKFAGGTELEQEARGLVAEMGTCRLFGRPWRFDPEVPDEGWDFEFCGYRIDVKSSTYTSAMLMLGTHQVHKPADVYCLVTGDGWAYTYRGCMTHEDLVASARFHRRGDILPGRRSPVKTDGWHAAQHELVVVPYLYRPGEEKCCGTDSG